MSNSDASTAAKWTCDYCTYENWPSAVKCTLCRGTRPNRLLIADQLDRHSRHIYRSSPLIPTDGVANENFNLNNRDSTNKWKCPGCTYLNWPKAGKCTQCFTVRRRMSPTAFTSSSSSSPSPPPSAGGDGPSPETSDICAADRRHQRRESDSPDLPPAPVARDAPLVTNRPFRRPNARQAISAATVVKWACHACTYENWPRAIRCVICQKTKIRQSPSEAGAPHCGVESRATSPEEGEENRRNENFNRSPTSTAVTPTGDHNHPDLLPSATACAGAASTSASAATNNYEQEMRLRQIRRRMREADWPWLNACMGVVNGDPNPVEAYMSAGGDPSRQLVPMEVNLLNRPSAFDVGHTLVHLAIRFHQEEILGLLLSAAGNTSRDAHKRCPSHVSPDLAADIRRHLVSSIRQRKGDFPCHFISELATFALPSDIEDLPPDIQEHLFDELLDRDVQKELEEESPIINWSLELTERLGSRLYALWNRTAGDCLLDSLLQATWGIFDRDNSLRQALSDSLHDAASTFYPRWKDYEAMQAQLMHFTLDEAQCQNDWALLLSLASQPGASLEQMHIFALSHVLRRPVIVYGVKYVKSFRGETIGYARFEGVYLPLLWEQSFCWKSPIALGYTRGHFSALIPMEPESSDDLGAGANIRNGDDLKVTFLPLMSSDGKLLPVPFLACSEMGQEEHILRQWLDCCIMEGGILVAQQRIQRRPLLVDQMVEEWLNHYRRATHATGFPRTAVVTRTNNPGYASDGDSDDE